MPVLGLETSPTIVSEAWVLQDWENSSDGGACDRKLSSKIFGQNLGLSIRRVGPIADGERRRYLGTWGRRPIHGAFHSATPRNHHQPRARPRASPLNAHTWRIPEVGSSYRPTPFFHRTSPPASSPHPHVPERGSCATTTTTATMDMDPMMLNGQEGGPTVKISAVRRVYPPPPAPG